MEVQSLICCLSVSQGWKYKKVEKWFVHISFSNMTQSPCGLGVAFLYTAQWRGLARSSELRMHAGWSPGYDRTEFKRTKLRSHAAATASQTFDIFITTAPSRWNTRACESCQLQMRLSAIPDVCVRASFWFCSQMLKGVDFSIKDTYRERRTWPERAFSSSEPLGNPPTQDGWRWRVSPPKTAPVEEAPVDCGGWNKVKILRALQGRGNCLRFTVEKVT